MPQPCPENEYTLAHARVMDLLETIAETVQDWPAPDAARINWGHVGSMRKAQADLTELLRFLQPAG